MLISTTKSNLFLHLIAGMDRRILLMLMFVVCTADAWGNKKNTIFKKITKVIITRSKWLITLVVDLKPYKVLLGKLKDEIFARAQMAGNYVQEGYIKLLYSSEREARAMEYQWKEINLYLKGIGSLQARLRKAIIPIVEKALSVLFGSV